MIENYFLIGEEFGINVLAYRYIIERNFPGGLCKIADTNSGFEEELRTGKYEIAVKNFSLGDEAPGTTIKIAKDLQEGKYAPDTKLIVVLDKPSYAATYILVKSGTYGLLTEEFTVGRFLETVSKVKKGILSVPKELGLYDQDIYVSNNPVGKLSPIDKLILGQMIIHSSPNAIMKNFGIKSFQLNASMERIESLLGNLTLCQILRYSKDIRRKTILTKWHKRGEEPRMPVKDTSTSLST